MRCRVAEVGISARLMRALQLLRARMWRKSVIIPSEISMAALQGRATPDLVECTAVGSNGGLADIADTAHPLPAGDFVVTSAHWRYPPVCWCHRYNRLFGACGLANSWRGLTMDGPASNSTDRGWRRRRADTLYIVVIQLLERLSLKVACQP